eukprot:scaffold16347_cov138-Isochrysis_galbana.AAC.1
MGIRELRPASSAAWAGSPPLLWPIFSLFGPWASPLAPRWPLGPTWASRASGLESRSVSRQIACVSAPCSVTWIGLTRPSGRCCAARAWAGERGGGQRRRA